MGEAINRRILSTIMDFIHDNDCNDLDGFATKLAQSYSGLTKNSPSGVGPDDFLKALENIKTNFFIVNRARKTDFARGLLSKLSEIDLPFSKYDIARDFVSRFIEIGYNKFDFAEERDKLISEFKTSRSPHERIMDAFENLLQKIKESFQISLHGTKEYSGIDVSKKIGEAIVGFQIKSMNDDISEDKIRAQTSKALEFNLDGFVWIYGRPRSKTVETSIQAAYHHFTRVKQSGKMYCATIEPELLAELFRKYGVSL